MSFAQSIRSGFRGYAEFSGTASRAEFWWWILFTVIVASALAALPMPTFGVADGAVLSAPGHASRFRGAGCQSKAAR